MSKMIFGRLGTITFVWLLLQRESNTTHNNRHVLDSCCDSPTKKALASKSFFCESITMAVFDLTIGLGTIMHEEENK